MPPLPLQSWANYLCGETTTELPLTVLHGRWNETRKTAKLLPFPLSLPESWAILSWRNRF
jgi:hypothetical protein